MLCFLKNWFHCHNHWKPNERAVCIGVNLPSLQKSVKTKSLNPQKLLAVVLSFERSEHGKLSLMVQFANNCKRNEKWIYVWIYWVPFWETEKENTWWRKKKIVVEFSALDWCNGKCYSPITFLTSIYYTMSYCFPVQLMQAFMFLLNNFIDTPG